MERTIIIRGHFANLTLRVTNNLTISVDDLRGYLTSRFGCGDLFSSKSTVSEMIDAVTRKQLWNYYNYHALEGLIEHFGKDDSDMIRWMEEYKIRLTEFKATIKIADCIKYSTDEELMENAYKTFEDYKKSCDTQFFCRLSLKLRDNSIDKNSLSYIDDLWSSLSDHFLLPPLPVLFENIRKGCIEITWIIPERIALAINSKATSPESIEFYQQKNIMHITMNDTTVFNYYEFILEAKVYLYTISYVVGNVKIFALAISFRAWSRARD